MDQGLSTYTYATVACSTINSTPTYAATSEELWNVGDQLGGTPSSYQYFDQNAYQDSAGRSHSFTSSPRKPYGHCYPAGVVGGTGTHWWAYTKDPNNGC